MDFKSFDIRVLKKYFQPQVANDLNAFLEKMPALTGKPVLMAAGIAWTAAAALGLLTSIETHKMIELRAKLRDSQAMKPEVPKLTDIPVPAADVAAFAKQLADIYRDLTIKSTGASITISSPDTARFAEFREAVGHVQNGGSGWRVTVDHLCVGRECDHDKLVAVLKINKVSVDKPADHV